MPPVTDAEAVLQAIG